MLSENQEKLLNSLYDRKLDLKIDIANYNDKVQACKEELKLVESAIINLEADRGSI